MGGPRGDWARGIISPAGTWGTTAGGSAGRSSLKAGVVHSATAASVGPVPYGQVL